MQRILLLGRDGHSLSESFYGNSRGVRAEGFAEDGIFSEVEIDDAIANLEAEINSHSCSGPFRWPPEGFGRESFPCLQPNAVGGASELVPDDQVHDEIVTLELEEDRYETVALIFSEPHTERMRIDVTARWESGNIRLYRNRPPLIPVMPSDAPESAPELLTEESEFGDLYNGIGNYLSSTLTTLSSSAYSVWESVEEFLG